MGSGAGSNRLSGYLLTNVGANNAALATPTTQYGTFGINDTGGFAAEIQGFSKFRIQLEQLGTIVPVGFAFTIYVSSSPLVQQTYMYAVQGRTPSGQSALPFNGSCNALGSLALGFYPGIPPGAWVVAEGQSEQSGTGGIANPVTPNVPQLTIPGTVSAIRAVLTTAGSAGSVNLSILGIP